MKLTTILTLTSLTALSHSAIISFHGNPLGTSGASTAGLGTKTITESTQDQNLTTYSWDVTDDYNNNGITGDDGYVTVTFTVTTSDLASDETSTALFNLAAGDTAVYRYSIDTSNLTGNIITAEWANGGTGATLYEDGLDIYFGSNLVGQTVTPVGGTHAGFTLGSYDSTGLFTDPTATTGTDATFSIYNGTGADASLHYVYGTATIVTEAIPEPSSALLIGLGSLSLLSRRKR